MRLTKFHNMKTYAVVGNRTGGFRVWHKMGRAKWYTDVSRDNLDAYISKLVANGYTKHEP